MLYQPPFPPTEIEAEAITNIGFMFGHLSVLIFMMLLQIFLFLKLSKTNKRDCIPIFLPLLVVYLFSMLIGMESFTHLHTTFSPNLEFFFLMFQTSLFLPSSFIIYENYHNGSKL